MRTVALILMLAACTDTNKPLGASCESNDECASGACARPSGSGTCQCAHDTDCPDGLVCKLTVSGGWTCEHYYGP